MKNPEENKNDQLHKEADKSKQIQVPFNKFSTNDNVRSNIESVVLISTTSNPTSSPLSLSSSSEQLSSSNESSSVLSSSSGRQHRKSLNEDRASASWKAHGKHVFILSSAGRPIYSRYGDELQLASLTAVLTGLISFVESLGSDTLRVIRAGRRVFVFTVFGPLYLVAVSHTGESVTQLRLQLQYLHAQIIAILTQNVHTLLWKRPQFDVRNLLGGTDKFLDRLLHKASYLPDFVLNSVHCLRLNQSTRDALGILILNECPPDSNPQNPSPLFYALLLANDRIVQIVRPKRHILTTYDLHLIINFLTSDTMVKQITTSGQVWSPLCLPWFNASGYMHLYATYLTVDKNSDESSLRITLVLLSHKADTLDQLSLVRDRILSQLQSPLHLPSWYVLVDACRHSTYSVDEVGVPELLHFVYTSRSLKQLTMPSFQGTPYYHPTQRRRLMRLYQHVHYRVHMLEPEVEPTLAFTQSANLPVQLSTSHSSSLSPLVQLSTHKVYYYISQRETVVAWISKNNFELYAVFGPFVPKKVAIQGCNAILRWINIEDSNLFLHHSLVWN